MLGLVGRDNVERSASTFGSNFGDRDLVKMLAILSPTKTLDFTPLKKVVKKSRPAFLKYTNQVVEEIQKLSYSELKKLLGVSDKLAHLNFERYENFHEQDEKQAMFAFDGPAFKCLGAKSLSKEDVAFAQGHLRILSGVYGVLRPCDMIRPYRLDMGKKLKVNDNVGMYKFWGTRLAAQINKEMPEPEGLDSKPKRKKARRGKAKAADAEADEDENEDDEGVQFILNCASTEYSKAVVRKALKVPVVDCVFKEPNGRTVGIYAKKARGMMCRYLIQERVNTLEGVTQFTGTKCML